MRTLIMAALLSAQAIQTIVAQSASHKLSNGTLDIEVMDPSHGDRYYRGIRFSPVANVMQVTRSGHSFLHAPASHDAMTEAAGLPAEFDILSPHAPPGFDEAKDGEGFVKIGVGVLEKTGDIYRFFTPYKVRTLAETKAEWFKDRALFQQSSEGVNGYAYDLRAEVRLNGNTLQIEYLLKNTGSKALQTEQYVHNFLRFDDLPIEPGYEIEFPYEFEATIPKPVFEVSGKRVKLFQEITEKMKAAEVLVKPLPQDRTADSATITYPPSGLSLETAISVPVSRVTLHASPKYFCPEQFVLIDVPPGETRQWTRTYRFKIDSQ